MKKIIFLLFLCSASRIFGQKLKVELEFKYTQPACDSKSKSGAGEELKEEKALANCKLYLYLNNKCVDSIKTNEEGMVIVKLSPGTYSIFESWKHFKKTPDGSSINDFYKDCLAKEWLKPNYKLTIFEDDMNMIYYEVSAGRCPNQYACLKVRHLPSEIKRR
jgi:hypothetical protein